MDSYTLTAEPILEGLQPSHPAHRAAVAELLQVSPKVERDLAGVAEAGKKGVPGDLVWQLAAGAPAVAAALVRGWRLWLERDRRRTLRVTVREAGKTKTEIILDGENISLATLETALGTALGDGGGAGD
jgi:hypothetical protein